MTQPAGVHFPEREAELARILAARVRGPEGFAATLAFVEQTMLTENVVMFVKTVIDLERERGPFRAAASHADNVRDFPIVTSQAFTEWANRIAAEIL